MSDKILKAPFSPVTNPIAIPETGFLIGTPASIKDKVEPQTEAIELDPLHDNISETRRIVYGKTSLSGITGTKALSAKAPCPISLLEAPRRGFASPVEKGGKL